MSITPTIDQGSACKETKNYFKQFEDWQLLYDRRLINDRVNPDENLSVKYELTGRKAVIKAVEQIDLASTTILECRFVKKYSIQRTTEQLASHDIIITVGNFYHRQKKALLMAYKFIPKSNAKIVK